MDAGTPKSLGSFNSGQGASTIDILQLLSSVKALSQSQAKNPAILEKFGYSRHSILNFPQFCELVVTLAYMSAPIMQRNLDLIQRLMRELRKWIDLKQARSGISVDSLLPQEFVSHSTSDDKIAAQVCEKSPGRKLVSMHVNVSKAT